jgi:hypothetical protein
MNDNLCCYTSCTKLRISTNNTAWGRDCSKTVVRQKKTVRYVRKTVVRQKNQERPIPIFSSSLALAVQPRPAVPVQSTDSSPRFLPESATHAHLDRIPLRIHQPPPSNRPTPLCLFPHFDDLHHCRMGPPPPSRLGLRILGGEPRCLASRGTCCFKQVQPAHAAAMAPGLASSPAWLRGRILGSRGGGDAREANAPD